MIRAGLCLAVLTSEVTAGCHDGPAPAYVRLMEARNLAADLRVQFNKAADDSNRAVMADTDEASIAFAQEAEQSKQAVQRDADALAQQLAGLGYHG